MTEGGALKGKRILIVDDEADVLATLTDLLEGCLVDEAASFEAARALLQEKTFDAVVLDIMGVRGYDLLELATRRGFPALMLTAHALSPDNLVRSVRMGAQAYLPKDKLDEIESYLAEILRARAEGTGRSRTWFTRLKPFFDEKFGQRWREGDRRFWDEFDQGRLPSPPPPPGSW